MRAVLDWADRKMHGNCGHVTTWVDTTDQYAGKVGENAPIRTSCRALVREDGKILSTRDCWDWPKDSLILPANTGRVIEKTDGPYLVQVGKRYEQ